MPPVRPSSLQLAEKCSRAPWLSHRYQEENEAIRKGNEVDSDVSRALVEGREPLTREGAALVAWVRDRFKGEVEFFVQRKVQLLDPITGEIITEGTPDLLVLDRKQSLLVDVDWKKKGQLYAGHLPMPDDNLQQMAYAVAAGMEFSVKQVQIVLACFDERDITPIEGEVLEGASWWPLIDRIKAVPQVDVDGGEPEAIKGEHCASCYQRLHCSAYLLPAMEKAPVELVPFMEPGRELLTQEEALAALDWINRAEMAIKLAKDIRDMVEAQVDAFVGANGPLRRGNKEYGPTPTKGNRKGPTLEELETLGLSNLIKPGKPGVKFSWRKVA
jgi:hypothetical protein